MSSVVVETLVVKGTALVIGLCLVLAIGSMARFSDRTVIEAVQSIVNQ